MPPPGGRGRPHRGLPAAHGGPEAQAVEALHALNYRVIAAGDSYNDTTMLLAADAGFLFHSPANVQAEFPQLPALDDYDDLLAAITAQLT